MVPLTYPRLSSCKLVLGSQESGMRNQASGTSIDWELGISPEITFQGARSQLYPQRRELRWAEIMEIPGLSHCDMHNQVCWEYTHTHTHTPHTQCVCWFLKGRMLRSQETHIHREAVSALRTGVQPVRDPVGGLPTSRCSFEQNLWRETRIRKLARTSSAKLRLVDKVWYLHKTLPSLQCSYKLYILFKHHSICSSVCPLSI